MSETPSAGIQASSRRLLNATAVMASGTLISRILGFVRAGLLVIVLGAGTPQADSFTFATLVPNTLYMLVAGGALNSVLVPQIVRATHNDGDGGEAFINRVMTAFIVGLLAVTVIVTVLTPVVLPLWVDASVWRAPAFEGHWQQLVFFGYLTMPQLFFYGAFFLVGQVLNARDKFGPMMWAPILNNLVGIAVLGAYLLVWGTNVNDSVPFTDQQVLLLGLGSTFGIIVQTLALIPAMRAIGFTYRPRFDLRGTGLGQTFHLAKWAIGYALLTTVVQMIVGRLASGATVAQVDAQGAGYAAYNTAYLVWILPHSLLTVSLATAMLPAASRLAAAHDLAGVAGETWRTMRLTTAFLVPAAVGFIVLGLPFSQLAFGHGANTEGWSFIGWTLMALAVGLVPYTVQYVYLRGFYALEDTRSAFALQVAISAVNIVAALGLSGLVDDPATVAPRLGLAFAASYLVGAWLTHLALKRHLPALDGRALLTHLGRVLVAVLPGAAVAGVLTWWAQGRGMLVSALAFVVGLLLMLAVYFFMARRLGIPEATQLLSVLRRGGPDESEATADDTTPDDPGPGQGEDGALLVYPDPDDPQAPALSAPTATREPGEVLDGRYRLDQSLNQRGATTTWRGWDLKLSRPVLVHVMDHREPRALEILDQARRAAPAVDARFLRVWDAVLDEGGEHGSYIVCEYAPGQSLELALRHGPFPAEQAAWMVREVALGLAVMHHQGLHHRQLNPDTVVITSSGNVKIVGFLVEHALHADGTDDAPEATDVRALGELLYASLLGRWPGPARYGLPAAPTDARGRVVEPRSASTRVPRELSDVVDRILSPTPRGRATRLTSAADVAEALTRLLSGEDASHGLRERLRYPIEPVRITAPRAPRPDVLAAGAAGTVALSETLAPPPLDDDAGSDDPTSPIPDPGSPASAARGDDAASDVGLSDAEATGPLVGRADAVPASPWGRASDDDAGDDSTQAFWIDDFDDVEDAASGASAAPHTPIPPPRPELEISEQAPSQDPPRRWQGILFAVFVLVLVVSLAGVFVNQATRQQAAPPTPGAPLPIVAVRDFDPQADGGDDRENPGQVALATDGNPATAWTTERYGRSADFNGRKPGAGLVVDLGEVRTVRWVTIDVGSGPTTGEVRVPGNLEVAAPPMDARGAWRPVANFAPSTGPVQLHLTEPVETRFVLVYLTNLPKVGANHVGSIHQITVAS